MKNKLFIFMILSLMLVSLSAVCAEDTASLNLNETDTATTNSVSCQNNEVELVENTLSKNDMDFNNLTMSNAKEITNEPNTGDKIYVNPINGDDNNNGSNWDNSVKTINKALTLVNDNGFIYLAEGEHTTPATINKNVKLIGQNQEKTILTNSNNRFLTITSNNVEIYNTTFKNNKQAIKINGKDGNKYYINNCSFIKNTANSEGGAIYITKGNLTINNSNFINNTATESGGAIYIEDNGNLTINNSNFINNTATEYHGGAIYIYDGNLTIKNSNFINNTATEYHGGAININSGNINMADSNLINNTASVGGAISISGSGNINMTDSTLINNKATKEYGGAIYINKGNLNINNSNLINNTASVGGAININRGNINMTDSNLINNTASLVGGAININNGNLNINNSNLINNTATEEYGGAININGNLNINNSNFINNTATENGGAIYISYGNLNINNSNFINNTATEEYGGAIYINDDENIDIDGNWWGSNNPDWNSLIDGASAPKSFVVLDVSINEIGSNIYNVIANLYLNGTQTIANIPTRNITFKCGSEIITGKIINGTYNKTYTLDVGDKKDISVSVDNEIQNIALIGKQIPNITIKLSDIVYGEDGTITVILPDDINGKLTIYVDNMSNEVDIINGAAQLTVSGLNAGTHNISAVFAGNQQYAYANSTATLNVAKTTPTLNVAINDIRYGEIFEITATLTGVNNTKLTGNVTVTVNNKQYTVEIVNGKGTLTGIELPAGNYKFNAAWDGDNNYDFIEYSGSFNVDKAIPNLNVVIDDVIYGEIFQITATLTGVNNTKLTGNVTVTVNNKQYTVEIVNGKGTLTGIELPAGNYKFNAAWDGDNNYDFIEYSGNFNVDKAIPNLNVVIDDVIYGEIFQITATLTGVNNTKLTGNVTVTVNNKQYTVEIVNGKGTLTGIELPAGSYNFNATWKGDNNYNLIEYSGNFNIAKATPILNVIINDIRYGEIFEITATLTGVNYTELTGNVTVTVNNKQYIVEVVDGEGTLTGIELPIGNYKFTATWNGDNNYDFIEYSGNFNVDKAIPNLNVVIDDIIYGEIFQITATLTGVNNTKLTGNVTVTVNNKQYTVEVVNGKGTLTGIELPAGSYNFNATWKGDDSYDSATCSGSFNVAKATPILNVAINDIRYGEIFEITAILIGVNYTELTGNVTVTVNNKQYTVEVVDGKGTLTGIELPAGNYKFTATWNGDNNYNSTAYSGSFNVDKAIPDLNVVIDDVIYGEKFQITATLTGVNNTKLTGNVTVTVNNKQYTVEVVNGKGTLTGIELPAGSYNFNATWKGDNNYNLIEYSGNFNIAKTTPTLNVIINDIRYGEKFQITTTLTGVNNTKLTGNVTVTVNNKQYTVEVVNGEGTLTGIELPIGNYKFTATWNGDNNYNSTAYSGSFNVDKAIPNLNVVIDDVIYGDVFNIDVTLTGVNNTKLTGNVTVTVNNNQYIVEVVDGEGTLTGVELPIGNYKFTATWNGDDSYDSAACSGSFNVAKLNATMDVIIPKDIKAGDDIIIMVNIPEDATGEVSVEIDGKTYTATLIKGSANITIPALTEGDYNVTITYNGDEKYNSVTKTETINVINNRNVNLNVTDIVMIYHDGTRLIAILTDYMGNPIANAKIYFTINGVTYNKTTDATGNASMALNLNPGIYNTSILFNGSDMYDKTSKNITVTIKSTIDANSIVKFYQNGTQFFATFIDTQGNILANTNVTFNINGVFYTRKTNENGTARLAINLRPGEYILTALNPNSTEQKGFSITVKSLIEADDLTKYFQNASRFEAKIYNKDGSLATNTNVTFNINGVFYIRTTNNEGVVSLAINLRPGTYTITTIYNGLSMGNTVKVLPTLETSDLSMKFRDGSKFQAKTVDGQGKPLANQTVTFNVNGVFYHKVSDNKGIASLNINLNPGEYIITSIWNNYQVGNNITIV